MRRNYGDPVYKQWRASVYKRDGFCCQMPGCKSKKKVQAHHIRKWSSASALRFDIDNGITLCWNCHKIVTGKEQIYEKMFEEIIKHNAR
jgi:5-methylcytosine-specific restriction endonuclease McrA